MSSHSWLESYHFSVVNCSIRRLKSLDKMRKRRRKMSVISWMLWRSYETEFHSHQFSCFFFFKEFMYEPDFFVQFFVVVVVFIRSCLQILHILCLFCLLFYTYIAAPLPLYFRVYSDLTFPLYLQSFVHSVLLWFLLLLSYLNLKTCDQDFDMVFLYVIFYYSVVLFCDVSDLTTGSQNSVFNAYRIFNIIFFIV